MCEVHSFSRQAFVGKHALGGNQALGGKQVLVDKLKQNRVYTPLRVDLSEAHTVL